MESSQILRWLALVVGCLAIAVSASNFSINVYINDIKDIFNYTQSQVELVTSMSALGASMGFPAGLMLEKVGPSSTLIIGAISGIGSQLLIMSATFSENFYHSHVGLFIIYMFFFGFANVIMYLTPLAVNIGNFSPEHRGKVIGVIGTFWWVGPILYTLLYTSLFSGDQNLAGYFIICAIIFAFTCLLCVFLLKHRDITAPPDGGQEYTAPDAEQESGFNAENSSTAGSVSTAGENNVLLSNRHNADSDITGVRLLKSIDFHLISWSFLLVCAIQIMFINNIAVYLKSYREQHEQTALLVAGPIVGGALNLLSGLVSDIFIEKVPRSLYQAVSAIFQTLLLAACITYGDDLVLFDITTIVIYAANGVFFGITPTLLSEYFGVKYFGRNWGGVGFVYVLFIWLFQMAYGAIYDNHIPTEGRYTCYGQSCFSSSFIIATTISCLGTILGMIFFWRERERNTYRA